MSRLFTTLESSVKDLGLLFDAFLAIVTLPALETEDFDFFPDFLGGEG